VQNERNQFIGSFVVGYLKDAINGSASAGMVQSV
jgi:hypothetical protein